MKMNCSVSLIRGTTLYLIYRAAWTGNGYSVKM